MQGFFAAPLRYFGAPAIPTAKRVIRVSVFPSTIARIARCVLKDPQLCFDATMHVQCTALIAVLVACYYIACAQAAVYCNYTLVDCCTHL
jgi:hypothetical protein